MVIGDGVVVIVVGVDRYRVVVIVVGVDRYRVVVIVVHVGVVVVLQDGAIKQDDGDVEQLDEVSNVYNHVNILQLDLIFIT